MKMYLWFLFCVPIFFAFTQDAELPPEFGNLIKPCDVEQRKLEAEFRTKVDVSAECTYPHFITDTVFFRHINKAIDTTAKSTFDDFVEYERSSNEEYDQGFGGCSLGYYLYPILCTQHLVSIYGSHSESRGCPHGWTRYIGINFWKNGDEFTKVKLPDLFIENSDWCRYLLEYCHQYFKSRNHGYYASKDHEEPTLKPEDLKTFVVTQKELLIVFSPYLVGGWADGPDIAKIPYTKLKDFINFNGPLKEIPDLSTR